jgi:hypothetical protein
MTTPNTTATTTTRYVPPSAAAAKMPQLTSMPRVRTVEEVLAKPKPRTDNPQIRELIKGFRYMSWNHNGQMRSGRIMRRNKNTVSVEPFDADPGQSCHVGYGLIYDVEPSAPSQPTANDRVKIALSKATRVAWTGKSGETIIGTVLRRNDLTMSVLPLEETDPKKYWRVPYAALTAL